MFKIIIKLLKNILKFGTHSVIRRSTNLFGSFVSAKKLAKATIKSKQIRSLIVNLVKKQMLRKLGKANFIRNWYLYGVKEAMKRFLVNKVPMELRKVYWFVNLFKSKERTKVLKDVKKEFWKSIESSTKIDKVEILDKIYKSRPREKEYQEIRNKILDKTFWFYVKSPETGSFSSMPQYANIHKKTYGVPIKSQIFSGYIKYYHFNDLGKRHWPIVKAAMQTKDYGREIYPYIRSEPKGNIKLLLRELVYKNNIIKL